MRDRVARGGGWSAGAMVLLSWLAASCAPANNAAPTPEAPQVGTTTGPAQSAEVVAPECPPDTVWQGDQCVQPHRAEPVQTAEPEPEKPAETAVSASTPKSFELENGALKLPGPVLFETGKEKLRPESDAVLSLVQAYLAAKPAITLLRIEGHSDSQGLAAANQLLTERRALSCAKWLVAHGVDCKRLLPVGFGDAKPIAPNSTAEGRAMNRRISFVNASLKGKPIGGMPVDGGGKVAGDPCAATP